MKVDISAEGIEKALEAGKADYDKRQRNLEVCVFTHLIGGVLNGDKSQVPTDMKLSIDRLFEILSTQTYQNMFNSSIKNYETDEVPSEFMCKLYDKFLEWRERKQPYLRKAVLDKAAGTLNNRPELGELEESAWKIKKR